jgi:hypothetical protein
MSPFLGERDVFGGLHGGLAVYSSSIDGGVLSRLSSLSRLK